MSAPEKENPDALELRARPPATTRLNRRLIVVLAGIAGLVVLLALMWGFRDPKASRPPEQKPPQNVERVTRAEGLASLPRDYASLPKPPPQLGPPGGELGDAFLRSEREAGLPDLPQRPGFERNPEEDALRAKRLKEVAEADQAVKGSVFFQLKQKSSSPAQTPILGAGDPALPAMQSAGSESNPQQRKQAFVERKAESQIYSSEQLQNPLSMYQLTGGVTVIPAALVTGINSDLPGQIIATVTQNVYDTVTGQHLLIPQGSWLKGQYDSEVTYGQRRVLMVWTRLTLPDGSSIVLDRLPGVDTAGYAGIEDGVDWHWRRIFAGAAISTLLGAGAELAVPENRDESGRVIVAAREGAQDTINQIGQEITRRNLDIQPTLTARPGLPIRVIVNRDLVLRPYKVTS